MCKKYIGYKYYYLYCLNIKFFELKLIWIYLGVKCKKILKVGCWGWKGGRGWGWGVNVVIVIGVKIEIKVKLFWNYV